MKQIPNQESGKRSLSKIPQVSQHLGLFVFDPGENAAHSTLQFPDLKAIHWLPFLYAEGSEFSFQWVSGKQQRQQCYFPESTKTDYVFISLLQRSIYRRAHWSPGITRKGLFKFGKDVRFIQNQRTWQENPSREHLVLKMLITSHLS